MADIKETEVSLKVVIDRNKKKVVFAEAGSDFVDILFSFLTMPMGTIVRRLANHSDQKVNIGCFNNLYGSVSNLDTMYFETKECKDMLLNTRNSAELICEALCFQADVYNYTLTLDSGHAYKNLDDPSPNLKLEGGFVRGPPKFTVTDDLVVTPLSSMSCFTYLQRLKVPSSDIEEQAIDIGMNEAVHLLRGL